MTDTNFGRFSLLIVCVAFVQRRFLTKKLGFGSGNLRFAQPDVLTENLAVEQGAVSPFALLNDQKKVVNVIVDAALVACPHKLCFHPNDNSKTVLIAASAVLKFIESVTGVAPVVINFKDAGNTHAITELT